MCQVKFRFLLPGLALLCPVISFAGPLTEAHVTKIVNEVKVIDPVSGDRNAKLNDVVRDEIALTTGIKSRSELLFQDNTLTRLGPESYFSFKSGTRDMTLQQGTLLLQVPKGIGGARIHTAAVTAAITGTTIMMEYFPNKDIKVLVLEGTLRLSMNGRFGDSLLLTPGKMIIMSPNAKRVPDPVTVDLKKVVQTSTLVNMPSGKHQKQTGPNTPPLPSMALIEQEINRQQTGKDAHNLIDTNLVILGKGTNVLLGSDEFMTTLAERNDVAKLTAISSLEPPQPPQPTPNPVATPFPTPNPAPTPNPNPPPSGTPAPPQPPGYVTDSTTVVNTNSTGPTIVTQGSSQSGVIYQNLQTNGSPSGFLFGSTSAFDNEFGFDNFYVQQFNSSAVFTFVSLQLGNGLNFNLNNGPNSVTLVGLNGITNSAASVLNLGGISSILFATQAGSVVLDSGISFTAAADFSKPAFVGFYARGGDVNIGSTFALNNSTLEFAAENNAIFGASSAITARSLTITGLQTVQFDGQANLSSLFQLNGGDVEMGGVVTSQNGFFYGTSATINGSFNGQNLTANVTGDFVLNSGGALNASGAQAMSITAGGNLTLDGTVSSNNLDLTATGALEIGGTITTNQFTATSATGTVNGILNLQTANFQTNGNFVLGVAGSSTTTQDTTINATGGGITLDGALTGHNVTLTATGDIAINHAITANQLDVTGESIAFGTDQAMAGPQNELTATNGGIDATGHQLSGFDQVSLTNGDLTAGGLSANTLIVNQSGNINVANNLNLTKSVTSPGSITVGGLLSSPTITAGDITTNALHANTVTSSGIVSLGSSDLAAFSSGNFSLTAAGFVFGANTTPSSGNAELTTTNGDINASGYQLSGFDQVSLTNGDLTAGGLSANTLIVNQFGDVNVSNNLTLVKSVTSPGSVTVGGLLTTPTITAGDITANALQANTVTSSGTFTLGSSDLAPLSNNTVTINAPIVSFLGGPTMNGQAGTPTTGPGSAPTLTINTDAFTLGTALTLNGGDGDPTRNDAGGNGGTLNITSSDSITVNAPISATTGQNSQNGTNGGNGGTVNLTAANTVSLNDKIEVSSNSGKRQSNKGGNINVTSNKTSGTAIAVSSSAQLLALLNASVPSGGGSIKFVSAGGDIDVNGATMEADRGTIDIHNNGANGVVAIDNATLNASTIKVGALGSNGTLNIGGGTISADSLIKLYAGGSNGTVNFTNNVTLSGNSAKTIVGDTVTIFNGKMVTILGLAPANVYTNNPNYTGFGGNGSTTGTFGGKGANTNPLSGAPGY